MSNYAIAFDVGGTFVKSAVLDPEGQVIPSTITSFPANAKASKAEILTQLMDMIRLQSEQIPVADGQLAGIGYAFPGPFDYERGICYVKEADKYESLYGVNVKDELLNRIKASSLKQRLAEGFGIVFENDAALFALGEYNAGQAASYKRSICMTLGTGTGSAFLEQGRLVKEGEGVPPNGWLYSLPFRDSITDDYISRRGILRLASEEGLPREWDVKEIADAALRGQSPAIRVFDLFGQELAELLMPFIRSFHADAVVIGGQIAKSHLLFEKKLRDGIAGTNAQLVFSKDTSVSTYTGIYPLLNEMWNRAGGASA
ncbi:glucokinase [Paenibacillus glycanilyticus]|uniref:Glucokinase n=2 Tax=Paenibacillus glycanilyticus TaxID=126569 RepID=A0ABQ6G7X2_9BACL|nr:glucokinase [Paenibacillus glycanilyticus]